MARISTSSSKIKKSRTAKIVPTHEDVRLRAYYIYLNRGGAPGYELDDWLQAEYELIENNEKPQRKAASMAA